MKVAIIGSRGIPGRYGGFETFAERLSIELVRRGHGVTVYGLYDEGKNKLYEVYNGVECYNFTAPARKSLQKPVLSFKATFHSIRNKADIVLFLGVSAAPFSFLSRLAGMKSVINLDGVEWKRGKWGRIGRSYLRASEWLSTKTCHKVVADSEVLAELYRQLYSVEAVYIPYGADVMASVPSDSLAGFGLSPGSYILQSCRLEPENNVHLVIGAYLKSKMSMPLAILGDAPPGSRYKERLLGMAGGRVRFLGSVYGPGYKQIVAHAALYIHAHEVGGTNPSLLEAMALGKAPLYLDVPFNREVAEEAGFPFPRDEAVLAALVDDLLSSPGEVAARAEAARKIIRRRYTWDSVVDEYEKLFRQMTAMSKRRQ